MGTRCEPLEELTAGANPGGNSTANASAPRSRRTAGSFIVRSDKVELHEPDPCPHPLAEHQSDQNTLDRRDQKKTAARLRVFLHTMPIAPRKAANRPEDEFRSLLLWKAAILGKDIGRARTVPSSRVRLEGAGAFVDRSHSMRSGYRALTIAS
jgi:hypothetical protein